MTRENTLPRPGTRSPVQLPKVAFGLLGNFAPDLAEALAVRQFRAAPPVRDRAIPEVRDQVTRRSRLPVDGQELAVYAWGKWPKVLLAHGFGGNAAQLRRFLPPLLASGMGVVTFDQAGHGSSAGRAADLMTFAKGIEAVARAHGPFDAVIAHSLGATAALVAHSRGVPFSRAVVIAPPGNVEHFAAVFAERIGLPPERLPGMLARVQEQFGAELESLDLRRLSVRAPARLLVMHDESDRVVPFEHGLLLAQSWPGARLERLTGVGHQRVLSDASVIAKATDFVLAEPLGATLRAVA